MDVSVSPTPSLIKLKPRKSIIKETQTQPKPSRYQIQKAMNKPLQVSTMMSMVLLIAILPFSTGFAGTSFLNKSNNRLRRATPLSMLSVDHQGMELVLNPIMDTTPDPTELEVETLTGVSHAALDFPTILFGTPSKRTLQLLSLVGRLSVICADYIPDHSIRPEELCVQLIMLAVTMRDMLKPSPAHTR